MALESAFFWRQVLTDPLDRVMVVLEPPLRLGKSETELRNDI